MRHSITYRGKGKWQTHASIRRYRRLRERRNAQARESRRRNR
jgi:hypothetical protein